ncbi:HAD family phosphatase [Roseovarius sp. TE539]|uniref:HAD family hydrolase n=1 Tax=Roseovarius sp. TE539 TaxID=2249812 RepID=UPI000DDD04D0|nr:HAD family phosphatase [Roseovarius sp. TE539]RBI74056.1 HAD family phosphatase [Roseovarius sp. TE539]
MTIDAVVFDIGNVLIEWNPERYYDRVIGPERRRALFSQVDLHGMNEAVDRGGDFRETIQATADGHPAWREEIMLWHDDWIELASPEIPGSVRLLRALRARGVPVYALTNFGVRNFEYAQETYSFLTEFDRLYVSGRLGITKPDPAIYARLEADCGAAPGRLLFADDRADNIAAAKARGWQGHLFDGPDGWAHTLVRTGLLTKEDAK